MSVLDRFRLDGRVALVTGAGRGIGRAAALALAEAGADVVVAARTAADVEAVAEAARALGRRAEPVSFDVMELDRLGELVGVATGRLGRLDVVVNNAGGSFPRPLLETSVASFERAFRFNVTTALELTKQAAPALLAGPGRGGAVVNTSSAIGRLTDRGFAAYGTAKAALSHLTRLMAADLAPHVRVNAVAVGSVATDALESVLDDERRSAMEAATPLRRLGSPDDIAAAVLYLASPAGSWVTGKVLEVDGGAEAPTLALGLPDLQPPGDADPPG